MAKRVVRSSSATRILSAKTGVWLINATSCGWIQRTRISHQMLPPQETRVNRGRSQWPARTRQVAQFPALYQNECPGPVFECSDRGNGEFTSTFQFANRRRPARVYRPVLKPLLYRRH